jgi:hypothetical protein
MVLIRERTPITEAKVRRAAIAREACRGDARNRHAKRPPPYKALVPNREHKPGRLGRTGSTLRSSVCRPTWNGRGDVYEEEPLIGGKHDLLELPKSSVPRTWDTSKSTLTNSPSVRSSAKSWPTRPARRLTSSIRMS